MLVYSLKHQHLVKRVKKKNKSRLVLLDTFPIFVMTIRLFGLRPASTSAKSTVTYCKSRWPNMQELQVWLTCVSGVKFQAHVWIIGLLRAVLSHQLRKLRGLLTLRDAVQDLVSINSATGCVTRLMRVNGQHFPIYLHKMLTRQEASKYS